MRKHVVVDLETLGVRPGSAILTVGAVQVFPEHNTLGPEFYRAVELDSCLKAGLTVDASTVVWWAGQADDAHKAAFCDPAAAPLGVVLQAFTGYLREVAGTVEGGVTEVELYGNGAAFDNVLLRSAYEAWGFEAPWGKHGGFREDNCFRTLRKHRPDVEAPPFEGTPHHALHDARHEARWLLKLMRAGATFGGGS